MPYVVLTKRLIWQMEGVVAVDSSANWIWTPIDDGGRNLTVCARRVFNVTGIPDAAYLDISADSRYVLFINGERVGQGPGRSWDHLKQYDRYEVSRCLRYGENVIGVQAVRWGIECGQYVPGPGGLIAQLFLGDEQIPVLTTDSSWRVTENTAYTRRVFRMAMGLAFSEVYDAGRELGNWTIAGYDDCDWPGAKVLGPLGTEPWISMHMRTIPLLAENPVYPVRVSDVCLVKQPDRVYSFDVHDAIREDDTRSPKAVGIMVAELLSDQAGEVTMIRMNQTRELDHFGDMRVNGRDISFSGDRATLSVNAGSNLMVVRLNRIGQSSPSWVFETELDFSMHTPVGDPAGPVAYYAGSSYADPVVEGCWKANMLEELSKILPQLRPIRPDECYLDIFALSNLRTQLSVPVEVDNIEAMCSASSECSVLPVQSAGDLEFLLDFGEEIVGFVEFELSAGTGTIVDFNCFEAIVDGQRIWTDNLRNTIRYTARDGWQRFHSVVRRGFRYAQVTIRDASRTVRIREIRCIKNTYPVQYHGHFNSSDALLNKIWDISRRTTQLCMEDTFVDCPAYEQSFWVGDARNEALAAYAAFGDTALTKRSLKLAAESLWRSPMPECVVPASYAAVLPNWAFLWVLACEELYEYTGDTTFVKSILPAVLQTCRCIRENRNQYGLFQYAAWNMLDWADIDDPDGATITHENALATEVLRRAAILVNAVGKSGSDGLDLLADSIRQSINHHLWDETEHAYIDSIHPDGARSKSFSQQTQTMVYLCNCSTEERLPWVKKWVVDVPPGWVRIGSPWMMWFSLEALVKMGDYDTALRWMREYWGQMLEYDATTCWETFPSWAQGRWSPTRSWCHAWSAAPLYFLSTHSLGVKPLVAGYRKALIAPKPGELNWAKGRVPTPHGPISIEWRVTDGQIDISATLPASIEAQIQLPSEYRAGDIDVVSRSLEKTTVDRTER